MKAEIPDLLTLLQTQGHLKGVERPKARLKKASLAGVDLSHARLANADFTEADLTGADLSHADLSGATFTQANLSHANFSHADLRKARFRGAVLDGTQLNHAQLSRALLHEARAEGIQAESADFTDAELTRSTFSGGSFKSAILRRANLGQSNFTGVDLSETQLEEAFLERTQLESCTLTGANLTRANGVGLILKQPGSLERTLLQEVDLAEAVLTQVDFRGADLSDAILDHVQLDAVSFDGAILNRTDFQGISGLTEEQLERIKAAGGLVNSLIFTRIFGYLKTHRWAQGLALVLVLAAGAAGFAYFQNPEYRPVDTVLAEAKTLRETGRGEEALVLYDMLLERTKDRLDQELAVLYDKADALMELSRAKEAAEVYDRIATLTANDRDEVINAQMRKAGALVESGSYEEAIALYKSLADDPTQSPRDAARALVALSQTYHRLGFEERAMQLFQDTLKRFPHDPEIALEVNLQMAEIYIQRRLFPQAEEMLSQLDSLARDDSQKVALLISRARLYEEMGNREKALVTFEELIRRYPENPNVSPEVKMDLAALMVEKGEYTWATRIYKDIIDRAEDQLLKSQAQIAYGVLLRTLGQYDKALELFRTVRKQATNNADLQGNSRLEEAETLSILKRPEEALTLLDDAIRNAEAGIASAALLRRAQLLQELGRLDEAAITFNQVSSRFDESGEMPAVAKLELARLETSRGNFQVALPLFEALLKDPMAASMKPHILDNLGQAHLDARNLPEAEKTFQALLAVTGDPEATANARFGLARLAVIKGDRAAAEALYRQTATEVEDLALKVAALDSLARLYQEAGDTASALSTFQQILSTVPPRHDAAFSASQAMAEIYEGKKEYAKAEQLYASILKNAEKGDVKAGAQLALGRLWLDQKASDKGATAKASAAFEAVVKDFPGEAEAIFGARLELAKLLAAKGQTEPAINALKALLGTTTDTRLSAQAVEILAGLYQETGRLDEALKLNQQLVAQTSEDAEGRFNAELALASSLRQKGDYKTALEHLIKLKGTPDPNLKANLLDSLAQTYLAMNDAGKAAEAYQEIISLSKDNQDILHNAMMGLASAFRAGKKAQEAVPLYEKVINETPDTGMKSWAQEALAQTYGELGQTDKAKAVISSQLGSAPATGANSGPALLLTQANLLRAAGDATGALQKYEEAALSAPDKADKAWALVFAAQLLTEQEKLADAQDRYLKVLSQFGEEDEPVINARLGMAGILRANNRAKDAALRYEDVSKGESFADYRINAGLMAAELYAELGTRDKAKVIYESLLKRFPDKPEAVGGARLGLAALTRLAGKGAEAAKEYEVLETQLTDKAAKAAALAGAARCYGELGQKEKARAAFTRLKSQYADQSELVAEATAYLTQK